MLSVSTYRFTWLLRLSNVFAIDADAVRHLDHEGINAWPLNRHRGFLAKGRQ
jgi:hypothetical protein